MFSNVNDSSHYFWKHLRLFGMISDTITQNERDFIKV